MLWRLEQRSRIHVHDCKFGSSPKPHVTFANYMQPEHGYIELDDEEVRRGSGWENVWLAAQK